MSELLLTEEAVCLDKAPGDPTAKVVPCGSDAAAYQIAGKGSAISAADAERFKVKTKKAESASTQLMIDGSTIAKTPEDKAYAATLPQPHLQRARAESIRAAAEAEIYSLALADAAAAAEAAEKAKKADEDTAKKLTAKSDKK